MAIAIDSPVAEDRERVTSGQQESSYALFVEIDLKVCGAFGSAQPFSIYTAYRRVIEQGYRSCRPVLRIPLGPHHKEARLIWCLERVDCAIDFWRNILWTDESRFNLDFNDVRVRVRRLATERFLEECIAEHDRYGGGSVMIWVGCCHAWRTVSVIVNGNLSGIQYRDTIVLPVIVPFVAQNNLTLQQDNARAHTSRVAATALDEHGIPRMPWPARSPDLSPIEHLWDVIERDINDADVTNLQQLAHVIQHSWNSIPQLTIQHLVDSMPRRLRACIDQRGGHTRY